MVATKKLNVQIVIISYRFIMKLKGEVIKKILDK